MLSFTPKPVASWDHRPAVSSPLSSSPVRASSPLSPINDNTRYQRYTQSSPIKPIKFKYSSRPARPNPVVRKREDAQEQRRRNFLQNVRQKAEDKNWRRRDIEGQFLKTNWLANISRLNQDAPSISDADIEDAMTFSQDSMQPQLQPQPDDEIMPDDVHEEEELEFMLASYEERHVNTGQQQQLLALPEGDDEYDGIFAELISQESFAQYQPPQSSNQMDMTD